MVNWGGWLETVVDAVPVVGTVYRTGCATAAHIRGDHDEAKRQWAEAGVNAAGDALGLVTGGVGKIGMSVAKIGVKAAVKHGVKQAIKISGRVLVKALRKNLTKAAMKAYAKKYIKKKVNKAVKKAVKEILESETESHKIIDVLIEATGSTKGELEELEEHELVELLITVEQYDEECY